MDRSKNYYEFVKMIESACLAHPLVESFLEGQYKINSIGDVCFPVIAYTLNTITESENSGNDTLFENISFNLLYADRLTHDYSNRLEVQSTAKAVLQEIRNRLNESSYYYSFESATYNLFSGQFADLTAGCVMQLSIQLPSNLNWCDYFDYEDKCKNCN